MINNERNDFQVVMSHDDLIRLLLDRIELHTKPYHSTHREKNEIIAQSVALIRTSLYSKRQGKSVLDDDIPF